MKSEALTNIRTMRDVKTGLDWAKRREIKTTSSLFRSEKQKERLESLTDRQIEIVLVKERKRSAALDASVEKARRHLLEARERLAVTINRNRALTHLRHELQKTRWEKDDPEQENSGLHSEEKEQDSIELDY